MALSRKDLVSFGNYLLSKERRKCFETHPEPPKGLTLEERLSVVGHWDIENWKHDQKQKSHG